MIVSKETVDSKYVNLYSYQGKQIGIPIFQRFYDWKEAQIAQLKTDILDIIDDKSKEFYFLDFIYYEDENGKIMLADGQQRLVTINNLIKAIKDVATEKGLAIPEIDYFDISYDIFANNEKYKTHFEKYATAPFKKIYIDIL